MGGWKVPSPAPPPPGPPAGVQGQAPQPLLLGREEPSVQQAARSQPDGEESPPPKAAVHDRGGTHTTTHNHSRWPQGLAVTGKGGDTHSARDKAHGCSARGAAIAAPRAWAQALALPHGGGTPTLGWPRLSHQPCAPQEGDPAPPPPPRARAAGTGVGGGVGSSGLSREGVGTANNKIYPVKLSTAGARCLLPGKWLSTAAGWGGDDRSCPPPPKRQGGHPVPGWSLTIAPPPQDGGGCRARSARLQRGHAGTTRRVRVRRVGAVGSGSPKSSCQSGAGGERPHLPPEQNPLSLPSEPQ